MKDLKTNGNKNNKILETILTIGVSTILMLIGIYYLPWIIPFYSIPFIVLGIKYGINFNIISLIASTFFIGIMTDKLSGIFILLIFMPLSISLNYTIKNRKRPLEILTISTLVMLASLLLVMNIMGDIAGVSVIKQIEGFFTQTINYYVEVLHDMGVSSYDIFKAKDSLQNNLDEILLIMPSIVIIFSLVTAYLNYLISSITLRRLGYGIASIPRFSRFKLPNNILIGTGIMFLGAFLIKSLKLFYYETIILNITTLISFMFFTQGLSIIDYKLIKMNIRKVPRGIIILFFIIIPLGWLISFIGVLDIVLDFRKFRKNT